MDIDKILNRAEEMQNEMQQMINYLSKRHPFEKCSYDDLVHVYYLIKISQLEDMIMKINQNN